ncbi:ABC transporter permease subunit [Actinophytocola sp.]|uniref:ABC transporter permease subunit n=1 Tax=Actinophytocola sp. TaxID=1872138 RepID=UPI00389A6F44
MKHLVHAEWTKFRTVRGWVVGMVVAIPLTVLIGLLGPAGGGFHCAGPHGEKCAGQHPPTGPDGTPAFDAFYFVHRTLTGDGAITARVAALEDAEPWAKAGVIVKRSTREGSAYASVLTTGAHGVRMQYDFTEDVAGPRSGQDSHWLRLSRAGNRLTGAVSPDGRMWTTIATAEVDLGSSVEAGMFVASPQHVDRDESFRSVTENSGPTVATTTFDQVRTEGDWTPDWRGGRLGGEAPLANGFTEDAGRFTISGTGDIVPVVQSGGGLGRTVENALIGAFAGLIAVLVVATMFVTSEYRRGLVRTSFAANPRRGQLLAAKAIVVGGVSFVVGVVSSALAIPLVERLEVAKGFYLYPVATWTEVRVVVGTGLLFGVAAVLAVAVGTLLRRGAGTVTAVTVGIVLPYLLAVASVLPPAPAEWLTAVTPAAAFAVQQSVREYPQVSASYTPADGFFPLSPAGGFAVLCGYAVAAVVLAAVALRKRDA